MQRRAPECGLTFRMRMRMAEQNAADDEEDGENCNDRYCEADFVGHQVDEDGVAIFHGEDAFDEVAEGAAAEESKHERAERNLKHSFCQDENFEREWRRQDAGDENA